jgi:flagellar hook-associated protein 3 FlgL
VQTRTVQNAMDGMIDTMNQLKTKTVQASNEGVLSDEELDIIREYVTTAKDTLRTIGNTQVLNRFMFAGSKTETPPFTADESNTIQYNGNDEKLNLQISDFENIPVTVPGTRLLPIFDTVEKLEQALNDRDFDAIRSSIDNIDDSFDILSNVTGEIGASINKMEFIYETYEKNNIEYKGEISRLTDTDYAEALSNLEKFNIAYQAAIEANQRLINTSLVNLLR